MPINPAIAMGYQAPKFEDPMNRLVQMEQLKAYQQNALAKQMEMQNAQETLDQQRGLRNYLSGLGPNATPDLNKLAGFGKTGLEYGQVMSANQKNQMETAGKLYKDVYLPQFAQAKTRNDVLGIVQTMEQDPRVSMFVTEQGKAMIPQNDADVPAYLEKMLVPFADQYNRRTTEAATKGRLEAAGIAAAAAKEAAATKASAPKVVGDNIYDPKTGTFTRAPTPEKPKSQSKEIENYEYYAAQQSKEGRPALPFNDWLNQKNIPAPKVLTPAQEIKLNHDIGKDYKNLSFLFEGLENVIDASSKVKESPGLKRATGYGAYMPSLPEGEAAKAETRIENLKGKVTSLGKNINAMSGAMGSMATQEWKILRDTVSSLDAAIKAGESVTKEQLDEIDSFAKGFKERAIDAYQKQYGDYFDRFPQYKELPSFKVKGKFAPSAEKDPNAVDTSNPLL